MKILQFTGACLAWLVVMYLGAVGVITFSTYSYNVWIEPLEFAVVVLECVWIVSGFFCLVALCLYLFGEKDVEVVESEQKDVDTSANGV